MAFTIYLRNSVGGELDRKTGDEIYKILRKLQAEQQTTLVVVTHDRRFIRPDDLVLEIEDGELRSTPGSSEVPFDDEVASVVEG